MVWAAGRGAAREQGGWLRLRGWACLVLHLAVLAYVVPRPAHLSETVVTGGEVAALALLGLATTLLAASASRRRAGPSRQRADRRIAGQCDST